MSRPNAITLSRSARGVTARARGAAAQVLFEAITGRLGQLRQVPHTLHFEDHGQDFLRWDIDAEGTVTDAQPYQADIWKGCVLLNAPEVGEKPRFFSPKTKHEETLLYRVTKVVLHVPAKSP